MPSYRDTHVYCPYCNKALEHKNHIEECKKKPKKKKETPMTPDPQTKLEKAIARKVPHVAQALRHLRDLEGKEEG